VVVRDLLSDLSKIACAGGGETITGVRADDDDEACGGEVDVFARWRGEMTVVTGTSDLAGCVVAGGAQFITDARPNIFYIY